jgi:hypothetical protein
MGKRLKNIIAAEKHIAATMIVGNEIAAYHSINIPILTGTSRRRNGDCFQMEI